MEPHAAAHDEGRQDVALEELHDRIEDEDLHGQRRVVRGEERDEKGGRRRNDDADVGHENAHARERPENVAVRHAQHEQAGRGDAGRDQDDEELPEDVAGEDSRDADGEVLGGAASLDAQDLHDRPAVPLAVLEHEEREHRDRGRVEEQGEDGLDLKRDPRQRVERVRLEPHGAGGPIAFGQERARALLELREHALRLRGESPDPRLVRWADRG